jgi:hypothetical protein
MTRRTIVFRKFVFRKFATTRRPNRRRAELQSRVGDRVEEAGFCPRGGVCPGTNLLLYPTGALSNERKTYYPAAQAAKNAGERSTITKQVHTEIQTSKSLKSPLNPFEEQKRDETTARKPKPIPPANQLDSYQSELPRVPLCPHVLKVLVPK